MEFDEVTARLRGITEKTKSDPDLRDRLMKDGAGELARMGIKIPEGQRIETVLYDNVVELFLLPLKMDENELSIKELQRVAGGKVCATVIGCSNGVG